jgi:Tol biopolymer transport system component
MTADPDVRDQLRAAADRMPVDADASLTAFHRARPRRDRVRRVATITTALGIAALAFAITWLATPLGRGEHSPAAPSGSTGVTTELIGDAPSGTIAYWVVRDNGASSSMAAVDLDSGETTSLDVPTVFNAYPVYSPDGSQVAYAGGPDYDALDLMVANADGSSARDLGVEFQGPGYSWSPDGTTLAFVGTDPDGFEAIHVIGSDGEADQIILPGNVWQSVAWSPDGRRLLLVGHPLSPDGTGGPDDWDIYTVAPDGTDLVQLTHSFAFEHWAAWSPSGARIVFTRSDYSDDADYDQDIWVMDADGSNEQQLTDWQGFDAFPTWSPDGHWILFASDRDATPDQQAAFRRTDSAEAISLFVMRPNGADAERIMTAGAGEGLIPGSWKPN